MTTKDTLLTGGPKPCDITKGLIGMNPADMNNTVIAQQPWQQPWYHTVTPNPPDAVYDPLIGAFPNPTSSRAAPALAKEPDHIAIITKQLKDYIEDYSETEGYTRQEIVDRADEDEFSGVHFLKTLLNELGYKMETETVFNLTVVKK